MPVADYREIVMSLNQRLEDSSEARVWAEAARARDEMPIWQRDVLSKLVSVGPDFEFLTTDFDEEKAEWKIVAFTQFNLVEITMPKQTHDQYFLPSAMRITSRSGMRLIEVHSITKVPFDSIDWPTKIDMTIHLGSSQIRLPLDRHASRVNMKELVDFYPSLINDLGRTAPAS